MGDYCDEFETLLVPVTDAENPTFLWSTGDIVEQLPVNAPGNYTITVTDSRGCIATNSIKIPACIPNIVLPNSITPSDQNGVNDFFALPQIELVERAEISIYDRYGTLVFYSKDKNFKWNGSVNGRSYYNATYTYILIVTDYNGIVTRHAGAITVL